jgi:coproporphyrinogen III oxidase-like Fe-S oxidoreductase
MITGLRLTQEGQQRISSSLGQPMFEVYGTELDELLKLGLIENRIGEGIKITKQGRLLGNQVFMRFV